MKSFARDSRGIRENPYIAAIFSPTLFQPVFAKSESKGSETLEWVKRTEFLIRKRIERQMDDEMWDGIMKAGMSGISVLDPVKDRVGAPLTLHPKEKRRPESSEARPEENGYEPILGFGGAD